MNRKNFLPHPEPLYELEEVKGSPEELAERCDQEEQTKFICDIISSIMQYITNPDSYREDLLKHLRFIGCNDQIQDHVIRVVFSHEEMETL